MAASCPHASGTGRPVEDTARWRGPEEILARCDPEIDWRPHLIGRVEDRTYRGHDGIADWSQDMADTFEEMRPKLRDLIRVEADRVLVVLTLGFRGRGSGVFQDLRLGHLWRVQDGLAVRFESFPEPEARAASGLNQHERPIVREDAYENEREQRARSHRDESAHEAGA